MSKFPKSLAWLRLGLCPELALILTPLKLVGRFGSFLTTSSLLLIKQKHLTNSIFARLNLQVYPELYDDNNPRLFVYWTVSSLSFLADLCMLISYNLLSANHYKIQRVYQFSDSEQNREVCIYFRVHNRKLHITIIITKSDFKLCFCNLYM